MLQVTILSVYYLLRRSSA